MRSTPGTFLPPVEFLWLEGLVYHAGLTEATRPSRLPAVVSLKVGRSFEDTFETVVHELEHVRDAWSGGYSREELERRAEAAGAHARAERWRW